MHTYLAMRTCASERPFLPYYSTAEQLAKTQAQSIFLGPQRQNEQCTERLSTHILSPSSQPQEPTHCSQPVQVSDTTPAQSVPSTSPDEPVPSHLPVDTVQPGAPAPNATQTDVHSQTVNPTFASESPTEPLRQTESTQSEVDTLPDPSTLVKAPVWTGGPESGGPSTDGSIAFGSGHQVGFNCCIMSWWGPGLQCLGFTARRSGCTLS